MAQSKQPITGYRIDLQRTPVETIAKTVEAYTRLGELALVAEELGVSGSTLDRAVRDFPDLAAAIQRVRDARTVAR